MNGRDGVIGMAAVVAIVLTAPVDPQAADLMAFGAEAAGIAIPMMAEALPDIAELAQQPGLLGVIGAGLLAGFSGGALIEKARQVRG